jgi:hypothetical protein
MDDFQPELGQAMFGQPSQQFQVSEIWEAALDSINNEIDRVWFNTGRPNSGGPMLNCGERFDCDVFSAHAYDWGDESQPWNFKWRDVRISWYKWCGRGMSANMPLTPDMAAQMLDECLAAVRALDVRAG